MALALSALDRSRTVQATSLFRVHVVICGNCRLRPVRTASSAFAAASRWPPVARIVAPRMNPRPGSAASAARGLTVELSRARRPLLDELPCNRRRSRDGGSLGGRFGIGRADRRRPDHRASPRQRPVRRPRRLHDARRGAATRRTSRELLTRYFDMAREVVERYGGTIEKFIGDAVMAVWGAPTAHEDDAERAVRAALDLVDGGPGAGRRASRLQARAGVLTGEAAVTLGATNQGMVAGDLVNTAAACSRSRAARDGPRRRGDDARGVGCDRVRGRPASRRSRARPRRCRPGARSRVVARAAAAPGAPISLEPPFVGRDDELASLKDALPRDRPRAAAAARLGHGPRPASARAGSRGSSRSTSTGSSKPSTGTRAGRPRTARASRSGRSARWSAVGPASPRATTTATTPRAARRDASPNSYPTRTKRAGSCRGLRALLGLERRARRRPRGAVRRLADASSSGSRRGTGRPRLRGPPVGRRRPARLHRAPAGVVARRRRSSS